MDVPLTHHFLSLPRPDTIIGPPAGVVDTTTLAAHDFDVDNRTGFMPPQPPLSRLPTNWELWEITLEYAMHAKLQLGDKYDLPAADKARSETWRAHVRQVTNVSFVRWTILISVSATRSFNHRTEHVRSRHSSRPPCPRLDNALLRPIPPA
jgi:hypothetical protein